MCQRRWVCSGPSPGLRTEFPPLRAVDTSPGNLRPAASSFIGRESEVAEVQAAVKAHRLVTLTGVGGVARPAWRPKSRRGWPMNSPTGYGFSSWRRSLIRGGADAVAAVLGITQQPGKSVNERVAAALEGRIRLLVFDNCEHVLDALPI